MRSQHSPQYDPGRDEWERQRRFFEDYSGRPYPQTERSIEHPGMEHYGGGGGYGGGQGVLYQPSSHGTLEGYGQQQAFNPGGQQYGGYGQGSSGVGTQSGARRGPKGYVRSDERIRETVCERLAAEASIDVSEVSVEVRDGRVILEGSVPERRMKHRIEDIVDSCWGVGDIENRIRVQMGQYGMSSSELSPTSGSVTSNASGGSAAGGIAKGRS